MKKLLINLCFILCSTSLFAEDIEYQVTTRDPNKEYKRPERPDRESINRTTPETAMYYLRTGFSSGNYGSEPSNPFPTAIGMRRYADEFYYGGEISSHYQKSAYQTYITSFQMGYHWLTLKHRIKPYLGFNFGYATFKDNTTLNRPKSKGVDLGTDFGFQIMKVGPFSSSTGLKIDHTITNDKNTSGSTFYDIYISLGFEF